MEHKMKKQENKYGKLKEKQLKVEYEEKESALNIQNQAIIESLE